MSKVQNPGTQRAHSPSRHKMAFLTFMGLIAPVYFIPPLLSAWLPDHPFLVVLLAVALIVALMVYLIMPVLMKLFAGWLFPARAAIKESRARAGDRSHGKCQVPLC